MPQYLFTNGKETKEIFFHMNDDKKYSENGEKWNRLYTIPTSSIDANIDPFDSKGFVESSGKKKGSLGDLFNKSAELSEKRAKITGRDDLKENYYKKYKDIRNKEHPDIKISKAKEKLNSLGVSVE